MILPKGPIKLGPSETIIDAEKFVSSHIQIVKANNGNKVYRPYWGRLLQLKTLLN